MGASSPLTLSVESVAALRGTAEQQSKVRRFALRLCDALAEQHEVLRRCEAQPSNKVTRSCEAQPSNKATRSVAKLGSKESNPE